MATAAKTRRWFRFRLRSLLVAITAVAVPLAWVANERRQSRYEMELTSQLHAKGVNVVLFGGPFDSRQRQWMGHTQGGWRRFAGQLLGPRIWQARQLEQNAGKGKIELFCRDFETSGELAPDFDLSLFADLTCIQTLGLPNFPVRNLAPISRLTSLEWLILQSTRVSDLKPLAGLKRLRRLMCDSTQVSDLTPLGRLSTLEDVWLRDTAVSDLSPLANVASLQAIHVSVTLPTTTSIDDLTPISRLTRLQTLDVRNTRVGDLSPLTGHVKLRDLSLDGTPVTDLTPLARLTNLEMLGLFDTPVSDLTPLAGLTKLRMLYLGDLPRAWFPDTVDQAIPQFGEFITPMSVVRERSAICDITPLAGLTKLTVLYLPGAQITDLAPLAALKELTDLRLDDTLVSDLTPLAGLVQLETLSLIRTPVPRKQIDALQTVLPKCRIIHEPLQ